MNKQEAFEALDGLMLSDGHIIRFHTGAEYRMKQSKHTISIEDHLKWVEWLRDNVFLTLGIKATTKVRWKTDKNRKKSAKEYQAAELWTERTPLLATIYDEWYTGGEWTIPKGHGSNYGAYYIHYATKIIPQRLCGIPILPTWTLTKWYLGDGGSRRSKYSPSSIDVSFSTLSNTEEEVYCLINKLNNMGIKTVKPGRQLCNNGSGLRIYLAQESVDDFMNIVAPYIINIFGDSLGPSYKDMIKYKIMK